MLVRFLTTFHFHSKLINLGSPRVTLELLPPFRFNESLTVPKTDYSEVFSCALECDLILEWRSKQKLQRKNCEKITGTLIHAIKI